MATKKKTASAFRFKSKAEAMQRCRALIKKGTLLKAEATELLWQQINYMFAKPDSRFLTELLGVAPERLRNQNFASAVAQYITAPEGAAYFSDRMQYVPYMLLLKAHASLTEAQVIECLALLDSTEFQGVMGACPSLRTTEAMHRLVGIVTTDPGLGRDGARDLAKKIPELWTAHRAELLAFITYGGTVPVTPDRVLTTLWQLYAQMTNAELVEQINAALASAATFAEFQDCYKCIEYAPAPEMKESLLAALRTKVNAGLEAMTQNAPPTDPVSLFLRGEIRETDLLYAHANPEAWTEAQTEPSVAFHPLYGMVPMRGRGLRW